MIGIDIVEHQRIGLNYERLALKILSKLEYEVFLKIELENRKIEYVASRFAAKEALYKATNLKLNFKDVSILNEDNGKPYVLIKEKKTNYEVSLSHEKNYSVAIALKIS